MDDAFKHLFETELLHLKTQADQFARDEKYRRLAAKMGLDPNAELRDPFVDWLLQGYAFLAARVQEKLGEEFPRFTQNLLSVVNPQLVSPTPSMIVAGFTMRKEPALMSGPILERGHELTLPTKVEGARGRRDVTFVTGRSLRLFPIEVTDMRYLPDPASVETAGSSRPAPAGVVMTLSLTAEAPLSDFPTDYLDLHVTNGDGIGASLFEALALCDPEVEVHGTARRRGSSAQAVPIGVEPLGFQREISSPARGREVDQLLPYDSRGYDGYRLLHEFFALPDRFHFLRLTGLDRALFGKSEQSFQVLFRLPRAFPELTGKLGREAARTNCVPCVNLFERQADDITITGRKVEHHILPDRGDPTGLEVHTVLSVTGRTKHGEDQVFRPFFAQAGLGERLDGPKRFFALNRVPRPQPAAREERDRALDDYRGSEVNVSLVDDSALPISPDLLALSIRLLCTNRHLPLYALGVTGADAELKSGADLGWDGVHIVAGPSAPRPGLPVGRKLWDAVSHLSLNYLSLIEAPGGDAAAPIRQLMRLYVPDSPPTAARIADALRKVDCRQIIKRIAAIEDKSIAIAPVSFARGLEISVTFDNAPAEAATLAAILDRFLAGYVSANTFTRTVMRRPDGVERLKWNPRSGSKTTL